MLVVYMDKGGGYVGRLVGMYERHEGHGGSIGIPQRESGIVGEVAAVYLVVRAPVLAVHVREYRWGNHRVVHGGIEYGAVGGIGG